MPGINLAYQASRFYAEARDCCGNRKHQLDSAYCANCKLVVALLESAVQEAIDAQPGAPQMSETNDLLDNIARIVRQETLAWAAGSPAAIQNLCGVIGGHVAREILKLKEPPVVPTVIETLEGEKQDYVRKWEPQPFHGMTQLGHTKEETAALKASLRSPDLTPHSFEDPDG